MGDDDSLPLQEITSNSKVIALDMNLAKHHVDSDGNSPLDFRRQFRDTEKKLAK
jgi:transposase